MVLAEEEVARRCIETLARSDYDAWLALHHVDCEFIPLTARAEGDEPYRGHAGCRAFWADVHTAFEEWRPLVEEVCELDEVLLLTIHFYGRGRTSGAPIDRRVWQVFRPGDGQALWWKIYPTEADALAAISGRDWASGG